MTSSGSDKSGSIPRVAASNVARDTPSAFACGHKDCSHPSNSRSAATAPPPQMSAPSQNRQNKLTPILTVTSQSSRCDNEQTGKFEQNCAVDSRPVGRVYPLAISGDKFLARGAVEQVQVGLQGRAFEPFNNR